MKSVSLHSRTASLVSYLSAHSMLKTVMQVISASLFLALAAQIRIPLFFTPVPITLQTCAAMLIGGLLGRKKGAMSIALYLLEGMLGAPFFANFHAGWAYLTGLTGGYLVGLIAQSYITGFIADAKERVSKRAALSILSLSVVVQMTFGMLWFSQFIDLQRAFELGVAPFVIGELFKVIVVASLLQIKGKIFKKA